MARGHLFLGALVGGTLLALGGCGGGADGGATGTLSLRVTDAPVDSAEAVVVEFTGVTVHASGGGQTDHDFPAPRSIDLLALGGAHSELLFSEALPAGHYPWVRLKVADGDVTDPLNPRGSYITVAGVHHALRIPSGGHSGLQLNRGFDVPAGGAADFTLDFDLRRSVHHPQGDGGAYLLRPTLRVVDSVAVGTLAGTVAASLVGDPACSPAVYVFSGPGVPPDDVDGAAPEPLTSALVMKNVVTLEWEYEVGFLPPGAYTVALTCGAAADDPAVDDPAVTFVGAADVTVEAGAQTWHPFE